MLRQLSKVVGFNYYTFVIGAREVSRSSSETVSLLTESTPGSIRKNDDEVLVPQGQDDSSRSFPYLHVPELSGREKLALMCRLQKESDMIIHEFGDLIHHTINSIDSSGVSVTALHSRLSSLGAYGPIHNQVPLLQNQLDEIERAENVDKVFSILQKYCSFFNYGIIEKVIDWFGTPEDKERLETYTKNFKRFCKRRTFECPPHIFGHVDKEKTDLVVKVVWSPREECTLETILRLHYSLGDILGVKPETLHLCRIDEGCIELRFQVPSFVEEDIFGLSTQQEQSLTSVGVIRLTCGSYTFSQLPEVYLLKD